MSVPATILLKVSRPGVRDVLQGPKVAAQWIRDSFLSEQRQWALWVPVLFGAGIAIYFVLPMEPPIWLGVLLVLGVWTISALLPAGGFVRLAGAAMLIMALGGLAGTVRTAWVAAPVIEKRTPTVTITGEVLRIEDRANGSHRLLLRPQTIERSGTQAKGKDEPLPLPRRVRISVRQDMGPLRPGDTVSVRAVLQPPPAPAAPGAFDYARDAWFQGLGALGYAVQAPVQLEGPVRDGIGRRIARWRQAISERIREAVPGPAGGMAAAVMTGDRAGIPQEDLDALRDSGLAHLLAISGLHMTAIAALIFFVVRAVLALVEPIALTQPVKKWAACVTVLGAATYLALSGASVSTQRAFIMVLIAMLAILADRPAVSLRTVAVAALVILILRPESLMQAGFQMSFGAVTALIGGYEALRQLMRSIPVLSEYISPEERPDRMRRMALWLLGIAVTTLIASLATAPFAAFHFNRLGQLDILANLVAVPVFSLLVMPLALAALAAMPLGLDGPILWALGMAIDLILGVAHDVSAWDWSARTVGSMPGEALALIVIGGLWLLLWTRGWRLLGGLPILVGLSLAATAQGPDLLADRDGRLVAVRGEDGALQLTHGRKETFTARVWLRREGDERSPSRAKGIDWVCEAEVCRFNAPALGAVVFTESEKTVARDCTQADVLIAAFPVRTGCEGPSLIIDRFDFAFQGAMAVSSGGLASGAKLSVRSARQIRGERPWVLPRRQPYHRPRALHPWFKGAPYMGHTDQ